MSCYPMQFAATIPSKPQVTRWRTDWPNGNVVDEGADLTFRIQAWNVVPGRSRMMIWTIGRAYSPGRWVEDWLTVIGRACQAQGLIVQRLTTSSYPTVRGTAAIRIDVPVGCKWVGDPILCINHSRKNRQNNGGTAEGQMLPAKVYSSNPDFPNPADGSYDVDTHGGSAYFYLNDTSLKPEGTPSYTIERFDLDGVSPPKNRLEPGDGITFRLRTQFMLPGTSIRIYGANIADQMGSLETRFGTALRQAPKPPNTSYQDGTVWPPADGMAWFNGGILTFNEGWQDSDYLEVKFKVGTKGLPPEGAGYQFDILTSVQREGSAYDFESYQGRGDYSTSIPYEQGDWVTNVADGIKYIRLASGVANIPLTNEAYWREFVPIQPSSATFTFTIVDSAARFWEVRAKVSGSVIQYRITAPVAEGAWVDFTATNAPAGFGAALAAATSASNSPIRMEGNRLYATASSQKLAQSIDFAVQKGDGAGINSLSISNDGNSVIAIQEAHAFYNPPPKPADPYHTVGVNLSTGEFGTDPGVYGTHYLYPSRPEWIGTANDARAHEYMDYIWALGIRTIRLPFKWGRIQREPYGPLYGEKTGATWSGSLDIARITEIVDYWTGLGGFVLLDVHNFGGTIGGGGKIRFDKPMRNEDDLPIEGLIDLWVKLANRFKANSHVWFGLMNEPNGSDAYSPSRCRAIFQTVTSAIRGRTGATNKILVPGAEYNSTTNWVANGQGAAFEDFYDPLDNFAFETHLYQDADTSGHSGTCVASAPNRILEVTAWARSKGFRLFMGEIAGGDPAVSGQYGCGQTTPALYQHMRDNKDVWLGWTSWGYGPWWPVTYFFNLNPTDYLTPSPPKGTMQMLIPFITHEF